LGWSAVSTTTAKAYSYPKCVSNYGYQYCVNYPYYAGGSPPWCYYPYQGYHYYCRVHPKPYGYAPPPPPSPSY
jgi:hypothetical protein